MCTVCVMYFFRKYQNATEKNKTLDTKTKQQMHVIQTQKKVIHAIKNTKPTDFNGNIERMRNRKL